VSIGVVPSRPALARRPCLRDLSGMIREGTTPPRSCSSTGFKHCSAGANERYGSLSELRRVGTGHDVQPFKKALDSSANRVTNPWGTSSDLWRRCADAGSRYKSLRFTEHLMLEGLRPSIGTVGDAFDNALMDGQDLRSGGAESSLCSRHCGKCRPATRSWDRPKARSRTRTFGWDKTGHRTDTRTTRCCEG